MRALFPRILLLLWSIPASRLLTTMISQRTLSRSPWFPTQLAAMMALACGIIGITWSSLWGMRIFSISGDNNIDSLFICLLSLSLIGFLFRHPPPKSSDHCKSNLWATWCMFAKWANTPPHWRVVDSYLAKYENIPDQDQDDKEEKDIHVDSHEYVDLKEEHKSKKA